MKRIWKWIKSLFKNKEAVVFTNNNNFEDWQPIEKEVAVLINLLRHSKGSPVLEPSLQIQREAKLRLEYQKTKPAITHHQVGVAITALNALGLKGVSEILALGYTKAEALVDAWGTSKNHLKIIISKDVTYFGVAKDIREDGKPIYCVLFARKKR